MSEEVYVISEHLDGQFGVTNKVKEALCRAADEFVYIGFLLDEADRFEYFREKGYESIYEYCEENFGFKRSSTNNFIRVYRSFGEYMKLKEPYRKYSFSQLTEMCSMNNNQLIRCKPEMTVREIRALKKGNETDTLSAPVRQSSESSVQTSGRGFFNENIEDAHFIALEQYLVNRFSRQSDAFNSQYAFRDFVKNTGADFPVELSGEGKYPVSVFFEEDCVSIDFNRMKTSVPYSFAYYLYVILGKTLPISECVLKPDLDIGDMGTCSKCHQLCAFEDCYCSSCGSRIVGKE